MDACVCKVIYFYINTTSEPFSCLIRSSISRQPSNLPSTSRSHLSAVLRIRHRPCELVIFRPSGAIFRIRRPPRRGAEMQVSRSPRKIARPPPSIPRAPRKCKHVTRFETPRKPTPPSFPMRDESVGRLWRRVMRIPRIGRHSISRGCRSRTLA